MRFKQFIWPLLVGALTSLARAEPIQPLDLKPFIGLSPFDTIGADWLPPRGPQVIDGTPFQIDGVILMYGDYQAQRNRPGKTNVNGIAVGRSFECLHLFATTQAKTTDGTPLAKIHFQYADGSSNALEIRYGVQVRNWFGPWHQADVPLADPNVREVWRALFSAAATGDSYLRMYHVVLTNPSPAKEVRTLAVESLKKPSGLMIAAMSVGPRATEPQPDTVVALKSPFPDLRPREGERVCAGGVVKTADGRPLAGARVRVMATRKFTAGYNDTTEDDEAVGTEAVTGEDGKFTLPPLPDDRFYHLLVFAEGYGTAPFGGADVKSDEMEFRLKPQGEGQKYYVRAQVVGPDDRPLAGVMVEPQGVGTGTGTSWGGSSGFPEQTLTGTNGEFVLGRKDPFTRLQVRIKSPGLAPGLEWLDATNALQVIRLGIGATVRGRAMKDGVPLAGVRVGVSGADRSSEVFVGHYETKTDTNGVFEFAHLPPNKAWYFYGIMSSLKSHGALSPQPVSSPAHGETTDLGELEVKPGLRLAGEVKTRNGEPLPKGVKVRVSHDKAWDSLSAAADDAGRFELEGLYTGQVDVSIEPRGWKLSNVNRSMDLWNGWQLTGLLEADKEDLLLVIEKGDHEYNSYSQANGQLPSNDWPQNRPLSGAERSGPLSLVLAGQVLDDKTGEPLSRFKIVPGYKPPVMATAPPGQKPILKTILEPFTKKTIPYNELPYWMFSRTETRSNGNFAVEFVPLSSTPMLRVEAEDYLPFETDPINTTTSNLVIRLKAGTGPNGVVLRPDGKPAEGAHVLYAVNKEQFGLTGKKLSLYGGGKQIQGTGKDGKFSFPMKAHGQTLFVVHDAGWAEESVERGGDNLKLRLQPWAVLIGTLVDANGQPMSGVELGLTMPHDWQRGDPFFNYQGRVTTDAQGRFQFNDIPPRRIEVQRMIPSGPPGRNGWTYRMQTWLFAQPGTNDLGKVTYDKPPPAPLFEQIKKSIGL